MITRASSGGHVGAKMIAMTRTRAPEPGWLLDEVASAGRENLDVDHVARYDAKEDAAAAAEVEVLQALGLGDHSIVVDLGAGTGQFTLAVAPVCAQAIAVDVSPVMLRRLQTKIHQSGLENVRMVQAGFLSYAHEGVAADCVYSRYALHHLPDFWKSLALERIRAMLRPGGIFRLWDVAYHFEPADAPARIEAWCATAAANADVEVEWNRSELEEHVRDEHSTYTWLLEPMMAHSRLAIETVEYSDDRMFAQYVARAV